MIRTSARALGFVLFGVACGDTEPRSEPFGSTPSAAVDAAQASHAADSGNPVRENKPPASWGSFGGDLAHTRSNPFERSVSIENVGQMKLAFEVAAPGVTSTPAVFDGTAYWADWGGFVHATKLSDHSELWKHDSSALGGGYTSSPAVTEQRVYVANRNGRLNALDRLTGEVIWESALSAGPHTHIWSSPVVVERDGILVIGLSNRGTTDNGLHVPESTLQTFRGAVVGLDAATGDPVWRLETSPEPSGPGVGVWSSAAIDTERHLAFIGTGNNFYRPVSPLSDSLLAIDYRTGELVWSWQYTDYDAWTGATFGDGGVNNDVAATPNLFEQAGRALVGVGDKAGRYAVHDRTTGEQVWQTRLISGPLRGGVVAPAAYHDDTIYIASNIAYETGTIYALRASDGERRWQVQTTAPVWGGPALANGVLYMATNEGEVLGFDAISGEQRWTARLASFTGAGVSFACGTLLVGHGYQDFESEAEPLTGGLQAFTLAGAAPDCTVSR